MARVSGPFEQEINTASLSVGGCYQINDTGQIYAADMSAKITASDSEVVEHSAQSDEFTSLSLDISRQGDVPLLKDVLPSYESNADQPDHITFAETSNESDVALLTDLQDANSHPDEVVGIPALPEDKSYHVMFSFSSEDRAWVRAVLEKLEAPPYNLKCGISDRDFHPGMEVLNNIENLMSKSLNIIMVISPEHLNSEYCDFEMNLAMEHVHQKRAKIIPVLRRGENVPSSLRFINYIDGRDDTAETDVVDKIYKAAIEGLQRKRQHHILLDPCVRNGEEVRWMFGRIKKYYGPWSCIFSRIQDHPDDMLEQCHALGMKISPKTLNWLRHYVNSHRYVVSHWLINNPCGWTFLFIKIGLLTYISSLLLLFIISDGWTLENWWPMMGIFIIFFLAGFIWLPIAIVALRRRTKPVQIQSSGELSIATYKKKFLMCIGDEKYKPVVRLIKYDVINCQEYIRENMLIQKESCSEEDQMKVTRAILEAGLLKYPEVFLDSSFVAAQVRHPMRRDLVCLCQFVEYHGIHLYVQRKPKGNLWDVARNWWRSRRRTNEDMHELIRNTDEDLIV